MADDRDEIRARINIVDLVGREIPLKQRGKNWTGLCPFHADKNPSFTVVSETGRYRCWSCGEKGDVFDWVMKRRNVDFKEAMEILAKEAGIEIHRSAGIPASTRQTYESAMDEGLAFFREQFAKSTVAKEYCVRRGLDDAVLDAWEIGYAPDVREALPNHLKRKGIALGEAQNLYLVDGDPSKGYVARFWNRLMFAIRDEKGALVAFGGRLLGDGHPKYINSSETPIYHKSRVLYGMNRAKEHISKGRRAVLVEGYLDVIACHRAGVQTAVASLGTSLTDDHARLLKRWCDEVVILYDSDNAGQKAADRAVEILEAEGLRARVALMPDGEDPDTLLKNGGPQAVQRAVDGGLSPTDYRMQALEKRLTPADDAFWQEVAEILADERNNIDFVRHLDRLAGAYPGTRDLDLAKKAIQGDVARVRRSQKAGHPGTDKPRSQVTPRSVSGELKASEVVIFCAFLSEEFRRPGWYFSLHADFFETGMGVRMSQAIKATFPAEPPIGKPAEWLSRLDDEELIGLLSDLTFDSRGARLNEQFLTDTFHKLRQNFERRKRQQLPESEDRLSLLKDMLRQAKPDTKQKSDGPDDLF